MRALEANRHALAEGLQPLGLVARERREMAKPIERAATGAERSIRRALHLVERCDRGVEGLGKLVHAADSFFKVLRVAAIPLMVRR